MTVSNRHACVRARPDEISMPSPFAMDDASDSVVEVEHSDDSEFCLRRGCIALNDGRRVCSASWCNLARDVLRMSELGDIDWMKVMICYEYTTVTVRSGMNARVSTLLLWSLLYMLCKGPSHFIMHPDLGLKLTYWRVLITRMKSRLCMRRHWNEERR